VHRCFWVGKNKNKKNKPHEQKTKKPQTTCEAMLHYFQNAKMMLVQTEKKR